MIHILIERFETDQLPNLERESLKFYKEQLKFADNDKHLAYYFFEHRNLSKDAKAGIRSIYTQYKKVLIICIEQPQNSLHKSWYHKKYDKLKFVKKLEKNEKIRNFFIWNKERRVFKDKIPK